MKFEEALPLLRGGAKVYRSGWKNVVSIELQTPDEHSKMTFPYLFANLTGGGRCPWLASQTDLLANDWQDGK